MRVQVWHGLHLRKVREVTLSACQISRDAAKGSKRDPRVAWLWWSGQACPAADQLAGMYARRYGQEHGYRFDKQDLLWDTPQVRTPEQFERWTDVVAVVRNQLVLARGEAEAVLRPWEQATRPSTPRQVRRAMGKILAHLGTPVRAPQPRGKAPGRKAGSTNKRASRCEVIRKSPRKTKMRRKRRC